MFYARKLSIVALVLFALVALAAVPATAGDPCPLPPTTSLNGPGGGEIYSTPFLDFFWQEVDTANWYYLWISKDGAVFHREWLYGKTSWSQEGPLPPGNYTWWVQTWNPCGAGEWSEPQVFSVDCDAVPAPELSSPSNGQNFTYDTMMDFSWSGSERANWAQLRINRNGSSFYDDWIEFPFGYGFKQEAFGYGFFGDGSYEWLVREWDECGGFSDWSTNYTFTVAIERCQEGPGTTGELNIDTTFYPLYGYGSGLEDSALRPNLSWAWVTGATWYYLYIERNGIEYHSEWLRERTNWRPDEDLPNGDYAFWVQTYNDCGTAWSSGSSTTTVSCVDDIKVDWITDLPCGYGYGYGNMAFKWEALPGHSWYQVWVNQDGQNVLSEWYDLDRDWRELNYGTGYITASPPVPCREGDVTVWVRGWTPSCGATEWSPPYDYTIECPLSVPVLVSPTGTVFTVTPTFVWEVDENADSYRLTILLNGAPYHAEVVEQGEIALLGEGGGPLLVPTREWTPFWHLPYGDYTWNVQSLSSCAGEGPRGSPLDFTIEPEP